MRFKKITTRGVKSISNQPVLGVGRHCSSRMMLPMAFLPARPGAMKIRTVFFLFGAFFSLDALAYSGGITGAYTDATSCSGCHGTTYNNYSTSFSGSSTVNPGTSAEPYTFSLTHVGGGQACKGGFNVFSSAGAGSLNPGAFQDDKSNLEVSTNGVQLTHTTPQVDDSDFTNGCTTGDGDFSWSFTWDAPTTVGTYSLQGCGNPVNGDGGSTLDGSSNACSSMTITVNTTPNAVNDSRTVAEDSGTTSFNSTGARLTILNNDTSGSGGNETGDSKRIYRVCPPGTTVGCSFTSYSNANGTVAIENSGSPDAYVTFTPAANYNGTFSFDYQVRDSFNSATYQHTARVDITVTSVNDLPIANDDGTAITGFVTVVEAMATSGNVLTNDIDPDDVETASRSAAQGCDAGPTYAASFSLAANGLFNYTHNGNDVATKDSFQYCAFDGEAYSAPATVYIDITLVSDPPTIAGFTGADATQFIEQTNVPILTANALTIEDVDNDNMGQATVQISSGYEAGDTLDCTTPLPGTIATCTFSAGTRTLTIAGVSSIADYENALEGIVFNHIGDDPAEQAKSLTLIVNDSAGTSSVSAVRNYTTNLDAVNDAPSFSTANLDTSGIEGGATVNVNVGAELTDPDDSGANINWSIASGAVGDMAVDGAGAFRWNPPLGTAPATFGQTFPVKIRAADGGEDGATAAEISFTITIDPPDGDGDIVADYEDFCISFPSVNDRENFDNDNDGVAGADGDAGSPLGIASTGGDVCDDDDDNDGMPDSFEDANGFDPLNFADASEDADGDGISNLQEFLDNTSPTAANLVIDATGYLTAYDLNLIAPEPSSIHSDATAVTAIFAKRPTDLANPYGPYRPGDNTITWRASNNTSDDLVVDVPANIVADAPERPFFVRPLVSFAVDQQVEESGSVAVTARLNGDAPVWEATPIGSVTVDYSVSGTASNPDDHSAVSGTLTFIAGDYEEDITFNVTADGIVDPNETIVFKLTNATNAVIGSKKRHTVTIVEENVAPRAALRFRQDIDNDLTSELVGSTYAGSGQISVEALVSDVNTSQSHRYDWSGTDNALLPPGNVDSWSIATPVAGNYRVEVIVTDNGIPARSTQVSRILNVQSGAAIALLNIADTDGDGIKDDVEGYGDDDADGVPNFLDAIDGSGAGSNLIPDQTVDVDDSLLLETEAGLTLRLGSTSVAANRFGALLVNSDIEDFGSERGDAPVNASDDLEHVGGIYDFEIDGLIPGTSSRIVIPLQSAIPKDARYRKYNPATGWSDFVVDANNLIESASGELGACPEPGSSAYRSGLNYLDNCIQLTIQDGGLNDTDNTVNGVVNDPSTVGIELTEPEGFEEVEQGSGGGRVAPLLLAMLLLLGGYAFRRRQRGIRID
jgi:hypothetical protein